MKPGRELDALVAERVMGLTVVHRTWNNGKCQSYTIGEPDYCYTSDEPGGFLTNNLPRYSENIAAAWEVVEKFGHVVLSGPEATSNQWCATFSTEGNGWGETAPHAICLAALKMVGWEEK